LKSIQGLEKNGSALTIRRRIKMRNFMTISIRLFISVLVFTICGQGMAADARKIGFFDSKKLLADSKKIATMRTEWESKQMSKEKEVERTQKKLGDLVRSGKKALFSQSSKASDENMTSSPEKLKEAKSLNEDLDRLKQESFELRSQAQESLRTAILKSTQAFAEKHGYSVIFDQTRAGVVYIDDQADITPKLIQWIDESG
jgi:Skp family chaperone for outer membrane proteins